MYEMTLLNSLPIQVVHTHIVNYYSDNSEHSPSQPTSRKKLHNISVRYRIIWEIIKKLYLRRLGPGPTRLLGKLELEKDAAGEEDLPTLLLVALALVLAAVVGDWKLVKSSELARNAGSRYSFGW